MLEEHTTPRPAAGIRWAVEATGVRLFPAGSAPPVFVAYPEAALWDFTCRGLAIPQLEARLAPITDMAPARLGAWRTGVWKRWRELGWVAEP